MYAHGRGRVVMRAQVAFEEVKGDRMAIIVTELPYQVNKSALLEKIACVDGYPVLGRGFESSVPGLHFLGAPAAWSYGPLARFVAGSRFAARSVARAVIVRRSRFGEAVRPVMPAA